MPEAACSSRDRRCGLKKNGDARPITLEEVEARTLTAEHLAKRAFTIEEERGWYETQCEAVRRSIQDRHQRIVTTVFLAVIVTLVAVALVFPNRYEMVKNLISVLLAVLAGLGLGRTGLGLEGQAK